MTALGLALVALALFGAFPAMIGLQILWLRLFGYGRIAPVVLLLLLLFAGCAAPVYICQPGEMNGRPIMVCVPVKPEALK